MYKSLLLTSCVLALIKLSDSCGISVHNEVTHRSLDLLRPSSAVKNEYRNILLLSESYIQAGSFFPDWGYQCLGYNQQAEDAHWAPFIRAAIDHIRENYPSARLNNDPHVQGLISFIYAIMSHDVADVRWHSLQGLTGYFIQAMAHMNFDGSYNEAHTAADAGGEFTLRHFSHLSYQNVMWKIPLRDIIAIYARLYKNNNQPTSIPHEEHLRYCVTTAFAASKIDRKFGKLMFGYYGHQSPFLVEEIVDFYKGGLQDMAASVAECSTDIFNALEYGHQGIRLCGSYFDDDALPNVLARRRMRRRDLRQLSAEKYWKDFVEQSYDNTTGTLTLKVTNETFVHELPLAPSLDMPVVVSHQQQQAVMYQRIDSVPGSRPPECLQLHSRQPFLDDDDDEAPLSVTLSLPASSVAIGHTTTIGDFNGDGDLDLAISAPYHDSTLSKDLMTGAVFILKSTEKLLAKNDGSTLFDDIRKKSLTVLEGNKARGRFGWSMATVDLNQDGIDDLAVAAPFASDSRGYVDIFFGRKNQQLASVPDLRVELSALDTEGLGAFITGLDLDNDGHNDLIIGCPYCPYANMEQAGAVYGILSTRRHDIHDTMLISQPDFKISSTALQAYEHFGASVEYIQDGTNAGVLLVGAPGYRAGSLQSVGRVYAFQVQPSISIHLAWVMEGTKEFQQFGSVIGVGRGKNTLGLIAIASPSEETKHGLKSHWQAGVLRLYDWEQLSKCSVSVARDIHCGLVKELRGRQIAGHLGSSLAFFDNEEDYGLWIGEPLAVGEKGRVYKLSLTQDGVSCVTDEAGMARFGSHVQLLGSDALCISSQLYSHDARFSGAIHLVQTDFA